MNIIVNMKVSTTYLEHNLIKTMYLKYEIYLHKVVNGLKYKTLLINKIRNYYNGK